MSFHRFFFAALAAFVTLLTPALGAAEDTAADPAGDSPQAISMDCGDSVDLRWRCAIVPRRELAPVLEVFEAACFLIDTLEVSPWAAALDKDGIEEVTHFVVAGRLTELPCPPDPAAAERLAELGLVLTAG